MVQNWLQFTVVEGLIWLLTISDLFLFFFYSFVLFFIQSFFIQGGLRWSILILKNQVQCCLSKEGALGWFWVSALSAVHRK